MFCRSVTLFKGAATPPPFRWLRGRQGCPRRILDMRLGLPPATRRYVHLPGLAASLVPHPPGWMARNATALLLSRCDRYSLTRPASLGLVLGGVPGHPDPLPFVCTRAFAHAVSYSCTTLAVAFYLVGSGCREAISDFTYPSFPPTEFPRWASAGVGYSPCEGQRLPPDLV